MSFKYFIIYFFEGVLKTSNCTKLNKNQSILCIIKIIITKIILCSIVVEKYLFIVKAIKYIIHILNTINFLLIKYCFFKLCIYIC